MTESVTWHLQNDRGCNTTSPKWPRMQRDILKSYCIVNENSPRSQTDLTKCSCTNRLSLLYLPPKAIVVTGSKPEPQVARTMLRKSSADTPIERLPVAQIHHLLLVVLGAYEKGKFTLPLVVTYPRFFLPRSTRRVALWSCTIISSVRILGETGVTTDISTRSKGSFRNEWRLRGGGRESVAVHRMASCYLCRPCQNILREAVKGLKIFTVPAHLPLWSRQIANLACTQGNWTHITS